MAWKSIVQAAKKVLSLAESIQNATQITGAIQTYYLVIHFLLPEGWGWYPQEVC